MLSELEMIQGGGEVKIEEGKLQGPRIPFNSSRGQIQSEPPVMNMGAEDLSLVLSRTVSDVLHCKPRKRTALLLIDLGKVYFSLMM